MFWRYGVWFIIIGLFVLAALAWALIGWMNRRRVDEELLMHQEEREWRAQDNQRRKDWLDDSPAESGFEGKDTR